MNRLLSFVASTLLAAGSAHAQAAGVDLVLAHGSVRHGAPCSPFQQTPRFPWISAGQTWLFEVYSEPLTTHLVLFGPPPTSSVVVATHLVFHSAQHQSGIVLPVVGD